MKDLNVYQLAAVTGGLSTKQMMMAAGSVAFTGISIGIISHIPPLAHMAASADLGIKNMFGVGLSLCFFDMMMQSGDAYYEATSYENVLHIHEL